MTQVLRAWLTRGRLFNWVMQQIVERVRRHVTGHALPPPAPLAVIEEAERRLAFVLPDLLRELYATIADGGFGPAYGFLPLLKPAADGSEHDAIVLLYELFRRGEFDNLSSAWPDRMLPLLDWGCANLSCVDCSSPSLRVFRDNSTGLLTAEAPSLEHWLNDWLAGNHLWRSAP